MMKRMGMGMALAVLALAPAAAIAQQAIEFGGITWMSTAPDAKVEQFMGREALLLRNGGVFLPDVQFQDGTIRYDMATTGHRSFVGAAFRLKQVPRVEFEQFYVRPHQTGRFDAQQYTPEINGLAAWQLYPEFNAPVEVPAGEWISVRLEVEGRRLEAFVGDVDEPTLVVEDLRLEPGPGLVALTSNFPEAGALDLYPTAFSNVSVEAREAVPVEGTGPTRGPPWFISEWAISQALPGRAETLTELSADDLATLTWQVVSTDVEGRLNIAEHRSIPPGRGGGHVYARVFIDSPEAGLSPLRFGFSDRGLVYLNGELLFSGDNTYRSRSLRYLGVMTLDNDELYIPLREGPNELVFAVSEAFGGWGLGAKLMENTGGQMRISAEPPGGS